MHTNRTQGLPGEAAESLYHLATRTVTNFRSTLDY